MGAKIRNFHIPVIVNSWKEQKIDFLIELCWKDKGRE
jgi:hypothetical protein